MSDTGPASIRFTLNGQPVVLTRGRVEASLADVTPETVRKHAVRVNGSWYPAIQAFEAAVGVPRTEFISHTARRHLAALGFEVHGAVEPRTANRTPSPGSRKGTGAAAPAATDEQWHTEANIQASLVTELASIGWRILSVANTATKQHGVDVIAERDGERVGVEVKGFPSRGYADPARADELKRTSPSTQAGHWFAQAVLAAMRLRGREPSWRSVIALPDFPRYRDLHSETATSLDAADIQIWWVRRDGTVDRP